MTVKSPLEYVGIVRRHRSAPGLNSLILLHLSDDRPVAAVPVSAHLASCDAINTLINLLILNVEKPRNIYDAPNRMVNNKGTQTR
jgi:hypothetical protein